VGLAPVPDREVAPAMMLVLPMEGTVKELEGLEEPEEPEELTLETVVVADADAGDADADPNNCSEENVWQLEEAGTVGEYGALTGRLSGP